MVLKYFKKERLKKWKTPLRCLRYVLIYFVSLFFVKFLNIFEKGITPNDIVSLVVIGGVIIYRIFTYALVPAMLVAWLLQSLFKFFAEE